MSAAESQPSPEQDFASYQETSHQHGWPVWVPAFLTAFARVPSITQAASEAGVNPSTVHRLKQSSDAFLDIVEETRNVALDRLETTIYLRATIGVASTKTVTKTRVLPDGTTDTTTITSEERHVSDTLAMFYLKRWRPEYRENFGAKPEGDEGPSEGVEERVHEAADRLRAEVIRLSDRRATAESRSNGSG